MLSVCYDSIFYWSEPLLVRYHHFCWTLTSLIHVYACFDFLINEWLFLHETFVYLLKNSYMITAILSVFDVSGQLVEYNSENQE